MKRLSPRRIALNTLISVTDNGKYVNLALKENLAGLESRDAAFISALVYETVSSLMYIDFVISKVAKGSVKPAIRGILRLGVCQYLIMKAPSHVVCNESVKLTEEIGKGALKGYVNGVMRSICRSDPTQAFLLPEDPIKRLSIKYSYPEFLVEEYLTQYGEEFTTAMLSYRDTSMTIRAQAPYTTKELVSDLSRRGISYSSGKIVSDALKLDKGFDPLSDELFMDGKITVQSESAMLVCKLCDAKPGGRVLDVCAAPGGKTAYLSMLMRGEGVIDAMELHPHRIELLTRTLSRLNVKNATVTCDDASKFNPEMEQKYDVVLVDAPCSGLGVLHKIDARYNKTSKSIDELSKLQQGILNNSSRYVKPAGTLIYSTCTISKRENEDVASAFKKAHPEFVVDSIAINELLTAENDCIGLQLFPHLHNTEGFYIARFMRKH